MKKILITGKNSYIGNSFEEFILNYLNDYKINKMSLKDVTWRDENFSKYDVVLHVAGIAHVSANPNMKSLYYEVNRDLAIEVAKKAKNEKVKQFIFMSSMIVFGNPEDGKVTKETVPNPNNFYGKSKLEAEEGLIKLNDKSFKIAIIRPPMIYGPNSKGNYPKLAKLARITPLFPDYLNKRSMLFIGNLNMYIKDLIDKESQGVFHPQNNEYVRTSELVKEISKVHNHKVCLTKIFNPIIKLMKKNSVINKLFGDFYYENNSNHKFILFEETIRLTEGAK